MGCLRGLVWIVAIVFMLGVVGSLITGNKPYSPAPGVASSLTSAPGEPSIPARPRIDVLNDAITVATALDVTTASLDTVDDVIRALATFELWAQIADGPAASEDEVAARQKLISLIAKKQAAALPALRDAYGPALRQQLWEYDGKARTIGKGFRTIEFVAAEYAANRNIKASQEAVYPVLMKLRFTRAQYKWFDQASEYQYYELKPPADADVVVWSGSSFRQLK